MKVDLDAFDEILNKLPSDIGGSTADSHPHAIAGDPQISLLFIKQYGI